MRRGLLVGFVVVVGACGTTPISSPGDGGQQPGVDGGSADGGTTPTDGGSTPTDGGAVDGGAAGCSPAHPCADPSYFCHYADERCGDGQPGTCILREDPASGVCAPVEVCGCDGHLHESSCAANAAGIDVALPSHCGVCGVNDGSTNPYLVEDRAIEDFLRTASSE